MGGPHTLEVCGLEVGYGRVQVLRGVALNIARGELVTIVGPNGAGKTTLLRAIMGLVPIRAGSATFDGETISGSAHRKHREARDRSGARRARPLRSRSRRGRTWSWAPTAIRGPPGGARCPATSIGSSCSFLR